MSHGDLVDRPPDGFETVARTATCPHAAAEDPRRGIHLVQFHPEVSHTPQGATSCELSLRSRGSTPGGTWVTSSTARWRVRARVGRGRRSAASAVVSTRRSRRCCATGPSATGWPGSSSITGFSARVKRTRWRSACIRSASASLASTPPGGSSRSCGSHRPGAQAEDHRRALHPGLRGGGAVARVLRLPRAGDALSRCHRVPGYAGPGRRDQEPPQCRRPPGPDADLPGGAAARALQGRGARGGKGARHPDEFLGRHPFPGPGLAVRILGEVTEESLRVVRESDRIFIEELRRAAVRPVWQAFTVLLPVRSVGVMGDERTYEASIVRAVTSVDGMTADWARLPAEVLERTAKRIVNEVRGSTAWRTTSPANRRGRSNGNDGPATALDQLPPGGRRLAVRWRAADASLPRGHGGGGAWPDLPCDPIPPEATPETASGKDRAPADSIRPCLAMPSWPPIRRPPRASRRPA